MARAAKKATNPFTGEEMTIALSRFLAAWDGGSVEKTCKALGISPAYVNRAMAHPDMQRIIQRKFREELQPILLSKKELVALVGEMVMTGFRRSINPETGEVGYTPLDNAAHAKYVDQLFKVMGAYTVNVNTTEKGNRFLRVQTGVPRGPKDDPVQEVIDVEPEPDFL